MQGRVPAAQAGSVPLNCPDRPPNARRSRATIGDGTATKRLMGGVVEKLPKPWQLAWADVAIGRRLAATGLRVGASAADGPPQWSESFAGGAWSPRASVRISVAVLIFVTNLLEALLQGNEVGSTLVLRGRAEGQLRLALVAFKLMIELDAFKDCPIELVTFPVQHPRDLVKLF